MSPNSAVDPGLWSLAGLNSVLRPVYKATAAAVTLGSGASLGPEGPSVDIGRAAALRLSGVLRSRQQHLEPLLAAGSGAGEGGQPSPVTFDTYGQFGGRFGIQMFATALAALS